MAEKKCNYCKKMLPLHDFGTRLVDGSEVPYATCTPCKPLKKKTAAKYAAKPHAIAKRSEYNKSVNGKVAMDAAYAKYRKSDKGAVAYEQRKESMATKYATSEAHRLKMKLHVTAAKTAAGQRLTSPLFVQHTAFTSLAQFRKHLRTKMPAGMRMADHGKRWEIEHKIPQEAYDFANIEDVKRCWSPENVHCMQPGPNRRKSASIVPSFCQEVGVARYPCSWNGQIPVQ
jgi:hypothetical protein